MKKILFRLGILIVIILILSQIALSTMPFSWGNERLNTKFDAYKKDYNSYNTIFVGASTTYRHLDPKEFDAYVDSIRPDLNIKSFNFGIPANRTPQSIYMLENLIKFNQDNIKYIVLDLSELTKMGADNLHKKEMIFWYTHNNIDDIMKASYESEKGANKIGVPILHLFSYAEKSLMVGMGNAIIEQHAGLNIAPTALGPDGDGFYSLSQELIDYPNGDLAARYNDLRTQDTINFRTQRCQKLYDKYKDDESNPNKTMEKDLESLIKFCNDNNIKIVIMLSQRLGDRYEYLIPLFNKLPDANKVGFASPAEYPQLNDRNNLFDLAHLNASGAYIFTKLFADQFINRIDMQNGVVPKINPPIQNDTIQSGLHDSL